MYVIGFSKIVIFCICITSLQNLLLFCSALGQIVFCFRNLLAASAFLVPDLLDGVLRVSWYLTYWMGHFGWVGLIMVVSADCCESQVALWTSLCGAGPHNGGGV